MPRRSSNHRVATTAASTIDVTPVPVPTQTPHNRVICHWLRICVVSADRDGEERQGGEDEAPDAPRSIADAANGPRRPNNAILRATAAEIAARLHPNSVSSGTMSRPGVARMPAVTSSTTKVTAATTQA